MHVFDISVKIMLSEIMKGSVFSPINGIVAVDFSESGEESKLFTQYAPPTTQTFKNTFINTSSQLKKSHFHHSQHPVQL